MSEILIQPFDPNQPAPLVPLFESQLREHGISTSPDVILFVLRLLGEHPRHGFLFTAESDGLIVGVAYANRVLSLEHGGWSGWLEEMYVLPAWRGRGVGSRLLAAVLVEAVARGWKALDLEAEPSHRAWFRCTRGAGSYRSTEHALSVSWQFPDCGDHVRRFPDSPFLRNPG